MNGVAATGWRQAMLVCTLILLMTGAPVRAQAPAASKRGASSGSGIASCMACHGAQGQGNAAQGYPRLAGQPCEYLARQLAAYAQGSRNHPVMTPLARQLDEPQREAAARAFAALPVPQQRARAPGNERGRRLAEVGDERRQVQGCANCHGPQGSGQPPGVPALAGQPRAYLIAALRQWQSGARNTDASGQMAAIARALDNNDVTAVAAYYAGLATGPVAAPGSGTAGDVRQSAPPGRAARSAAPPASAAGSAVRGGDAASAAR